MNLRKTIYLFLSAITLITLVTSCSLQKRIYRNGYHVAWNNKRTGDVKRTESLKEEKSPRIKEELPEVIVVSSNNDIKSDVISLKRKPLLILDKDTCGDVLLLQNADEIAVKILEIDDNSIKYKRCDNINGPTYSISKRKVALIKYANGTKEVIMQEPVVTEPKSKEVYKQPAGPRKTNPLGLVSLLGFILANIISRPLTRSMITGSSFLLLAVLALAPLVMAYISLFQFKNHPEMYKGKWMPVVVVCVNLASLLILMLALSAVGTISSTFLFSILLIFLILLGILIAALLPKQSPPTNMK